MKVTRILQNRMSRALHPLKGSQLQGTRPPMETARRIPSDSSRIVRKASGSVSASRYLRLLAATAMLGTIDGLQAKYVTVGNLGEEEAVAYQVVFMLVAAGAAYYCLFDMKWSQARNLSNMLLAIPVATLADNVSIDVQTLHPYFLLIPSNGYLWRIDVFGGTFFSPLAYWVNEQWLMPGLINGYLAAISIFATYLALQFFWVRGNLDSHLPDLKLDFPFDQRLRKHWLSKMEVNA